MGSTPLHSRALGPRGREEGGGESSREVESDVRVKELKAAERRRRRKDCEKVVAIKGAQQSGTVRGFGATKGIKERGKRRWLAYRSNAAVVKVIAKATANLS